MPDIRVYAVSGRLQAGMDWAQTGSSATGEISMAEAIKFLEGGALCMSSKDYKRQKTAIEEACYRLGDTCTYETKQAISKVNASIEALQIKAKR